MWVWRQTAKAKVMLLQGCQPVLLAPAPPNQGQGYCPHRNKTPSQIFSWPGWTFVVNSKEDGQQWSTTLGWWWGFTEVRRREGWVEAGVAQGKASVCFGGNKAQRRAQEDEALLILLRFSVHDCYRVNRRQWEGFLLALLTVTFAHHFFPCPSEAVLKEKHIQKNRDGQRKLYKIPLPAPRWPPARNAWTTSVLRNSAFCHNFITVGHFFGKTRKYWLFQALNQDFPQDKGKKFIETIFYLHHFV